MAQIRPWRFRVQHAATAIRRGGVVLYPTEGVWGLGCDPRNATALDRLIRLKRRDDRKGLILLLSNEQAAAPWLRAQHSERTPLHGRRFARFHPNIGWRSGSTCARRDHPVMCEGFDSSPRATTYLYLSRRGIPPQLCGRYPTLAIRNTQHAPAKALCRASGGAITSTSANISGMRHPPLSRWAVLRQWGPHVDRVLNAPLGGQTRPSRIFDTVSRQWIRH